MKLDSRILEGKKPLTCFDIEEAKKYVGKDCYFSSKFENFENLSKVPHATLHNVDDSHTPFQCYGKDGVLCYDCFILPCEWVKDPEKKYRPYSLNEFLNKHEIGDKITYRLKLDKQPENFIRRQDMICGYQIETGKADVPGEGLINLGGMCVSLQAMFNIYETPNNYLYPEVWQPFGVVDKEE